MQGTPLWSNWSVRHVATHQDGSVVDRGLRFAQGASVLVVLLVTSRPGVVHLHTSSRGSFVRKSLLTWATRASGVPVILHVHGGSFADFHDNSPRWFQRYIRATFETSEFVIALGVSWAERLQRVAPGARVVVVPNAVAPRPRTARPDQSVSRPPVVLFLGRLSEDKGVHVLLDAWARLPDPRTDDPPARLVLAGDGEVDRFRREIAERGLTDSVELPGWVTPGRVEELLDEADVLVLPSRWEGQPMAVLEAMARGLPVVASRVGGLPDLVDAGTGILVEPDDAPALEQALRHLLDAQELRERLGAGGLQRVRDEFDVGVISQRLEELYEEVTR
ncbi:glycosyltransferase family 4 protein [Nocardioides aurantiacus]|uniref:glycosyltransferase family 4 protein n=1 Tax=Nocardioides aurantiacus TaxID=86796 RepID=UPI00403F3AC4